MNNEIYKVHSQNMNQIKCGEVEYLTYPLIENTGFVRHLFTTRFGGVSEGYLGSMNLSYQRGDKKENVDENYKRIAGVLNSSLSDFVMTDQVHDVKILTVSREDAGLGITEEREESKKKVDGLITNQKNIVLGALFADCIPLYFVDPVHKAIGLAHAGWRGSVLGMAHHMVERMKKEYHTRPQELIAAIGPGICRNCYEVDEEVALKFRHLMTYLVVPGRTAKQLEDELILDCGKDKYLLDLKLTNYYILLSCGLMEKNISISDLCTCCHSDYLFSHRASKGKRGNLGAFIKIDELNPQ